MREQREELQMIYKALQNMADDSSIDIANVAIETFYLLRAVEQAPMSMFQRTNVDLAKLTALFGTLSSVLEYHAVVETFREMRCFMVNDSVLSSRELLLLLHKWNLVSKDLQLQEDLQPMAQKY
ncbi:unnamed protein product [Coccothraustes coccothraustes]